MLIHTLNHRQKSASDFVAPSQGLLFDRIKGSINVASPRKVTAELAEDDVQQVLSTEPKRP